MTTHFTDADAKKLAEAKAKVAEYELMQAKDEHAAAEAVRAHTMKAMKPVADALSGLDTDKLAAVMESAKGKATGDTVVRLDILFNTFKHHVPQMLATIDGLAEPLPEPTLDEAG